MLSELENVSIQELKQMFDNHHKLTHLSLDFDEFELNSEAIEVIKGCSTKVVYLRFKGLINTPSYPTLQALFEENFPIVKFYNYSSGSGELVLKKRNTNDWHKSLNLMSYT